MKKMLLTLFTWWNGQTFNSMYHTWRHGTAVGEDVYGNVYYRGGTDSEGRERRWVIYKDVSEATLVPAGWHGWLHHTSELPPTEQDYQPKEWQIGHRPNLTGTSMAYKPKGAITGVGERPQVTGDYDAWTPGG